MRTMEPTQIVRGERIEWTKCYADFSAETYTLTYRFRGQGAGFDVTATADGSGFEAAVTKTQSATMAVGKYRWQAWLTEIADSENTFLVGEGVVQVRQGFVAGDTAAVDLRSTAKQTLDAIEAMLLNRASNDQLEYEVETPAGRRRVKRMSRTELLEMRDKYAAIVARENAAERVRNGGKFGKTVVMRVREN